jgi:demethylmenaquinone methyltransferase/2-methoxy-6-polyprenyl-1,4-benzoquinol methylase
MEEESPKLYRPEKNQVTEMFNNISPKYDLLNNMLSFGIHKAWKRKAIRQFKNDRIETFLDVATGTADLAILARKLKPKQISGVDISIQMLDTGRKKIKKRKLDKLIRLVLADSEVLPFLDNSFDGVTAGFGVRNFEDLLKGLAEMHRVLRPGAKAVILEFSVPTKSPFRQLYHFYFTAILPVIGKLVSRHRQAYQYLPDSVNRFPAGMEFLKIMESAGFRNTRFILLSFGIASLYIGEKLP